MKLALGRVVARHCVPPWLASAYFSLKYRCLVSPSARVQLTGKIEFGRRTTVKPFAIIQTHNGRIKVGADCAISSFDHISTGDGDITIGDNVRIGPSVTIVASSRHFRARSVVITEQGYSSVGLTIGNDVLIGAGVVILDGCHVGTGAVIGAGSIVTGDVPPYTVVAGVPARAIGERYDDAEAPS
jgi:acetyltransferase-like isoleucine patch superfamily enzyme